MKNILNSCKIYIDRLRDGKVEKVIEELPQSFLEVSEPELIFSTPLQISIKAYISEKHLVLNIDAKTTCTTPCTICNEKTQQTLVLKNYYHTQPLDELEAIFDVAPLIREAILLEVKTYIECNDGACPGRDQILSYLKKNDCTLSSDVNYPFAGLN